MEDLEVRVQADFWRGRRVLVTGSTGFKGSWLCLWLKRRGAEVAGYALPPNTDPSLFTILKLENDLKVQTFDDIRNLDAVKDAVKTFEPSVVLHLAAQPLVRESYRTPLETFSTNVMGTAHLLEAVRACRSVQATVIVTTDKVYENQEWIWGYRENEPLGGFDPYSSSKACAELVTAAYRQSFFQDKCGGLATARAGNVLGGGDWSEDRLIPDAARAFAAGQRVEIRNPQAVRPWQHVLDPLHGYLLLAESLVNKPSVFSEAWNFGPEDSDVVPVSEVMMGFTGAWGPGAEWQDISTEHNGPHEAGLLKLDASKAKHRLKWHQHITLANCLKLTAEWYCAHAKGGNDDALRALTLAQIDQYMTLCE